MNRQGQIGFSQRIQLEWLDYTVNLVLAGNSRQEIVSALGDRLRAALSVGNNPKRGNRDKAITILTKIWVAVPGELETLRDQGLDFLQRSPISDRMLVHWCMCMAVYPFFGTVADATGRLLRLQGTAGAAQVQRRLREQFGERETVARAARRILRVFVDWGVLEETGKKGFYCGAAKRAVAVDNVSLSVWVLAAVLAAKGGSSQRATTLLNGPHLFPFDIALPPVRAMEADGNLDVIRHGLDHEILIGLAERRG